MSTQINYFMFSLFFNLRIHSTQLKHIQALMHNIITKGFEWSSSIFLMASWPYNRLRRWHQADGQPGLYQAVSINPGTFSDGQAAIPDEFTRRRALQPFIFSPGSTQESQSLMAISPCSLVLTRPCFFPTYVAIFRFNSRQRWSTLESSA